MLQYFSEGSVKVIVPSFCSKANSCEAPACASGVATHTLLTFPATFNFKGTLVTNRGSGIVPFRSLQLKLFALRKFSR